MTRCIGMIYVFAYETTVVLITANETKIDQMKQNLFRAGPVFPKSSVI